jgi:thioredoxin 1
MGDKANVKHSDDQHFSSTVLKQDGPFLVDFWAPWCGPCRMVSPIVDEIAGERKDILVGKVNVDEEMELAAQFQVMSIPTLVVLRNGQVVNRVVGARPKDAILSLL